MYFVLQNIFSLCKNFLSLLGIENAEVIQNKFKYWIATPSLRLARNDNFNYINAFYYGLKNNFAILNLVKSFLTFIKFNFDSLSREIKNSCLVINKNLFKIKRIKNETFKTI